MYICTAACNMTHYTARSVDMDGTMIKKATILQRCYLLPKLHPTDGHNIHRNLVNGF